MNLYNTYKNLILENVESTIDKLIKGETTQNGKKYYYGVKLTYGNDVEPRFVFIYGDGKTQKSNPGIRAFQASGPSESGQPNGYYKIFLIDKIKKIEVTNFKWYKPVDQVSGGEGIPKFVGPQDKSFLNGLENFVTF